MRYGLTPDILFALKEQTKQLAGSIVHELFDSHVYLITGRDDPLADKTLITHRNDPRKSVKDFIDILKELYDRAVAFPL